MVAVTLAAALAGCSGSTAETGEQAKSAASAAQSSTAKPEPSTSSIATELGPVTGTKTVTGNASTARANPVSVRLDFHGLHRDGKLLRLDYSVTSLETTGERFYVPNLLSTIGASEIYLLDSTRLKKYLIVKDSKQQFLFARPNVYLADNQRFEGAAYYPAPPADVTELELVFGNYGRYKTPVSG